MVRPVRGIVPPTSFTHVEERFSRSLSLPPSLSVGFTFPAFPYLFLLQGGFGGDEEDSESMELLALRRAEGGRPGV